MEPVMTFTFRRRLFAAASVALLALGAGHAVAGSHNDADAAVVETSQTGDALEALPRLPISQRRIVGIYQFRSGVAGVQNAAAADMFTTALVESGAFMVGERSQLTTDVLAERQLNANGQSTGDVAMHQLAGAQLLNQVRA
jgi:curli biogenesis system outer membrane secretion channel CsgG